MPIVTPSKAALAASIEGLLGYSAEYVGCSVGGGAAGGDPAPGVGSGGHTTLSLSTSANWRLLADSHALVLGAVTQSEDTAALTPMGRGVGGAPPSNFDCRGRLALDNAVRLRGADARWPTL